MIPEVHTLVGYEDVLDACRLSVRENEDLVQLFEEEFASYVGVPYARCFSSGRAALYTIFEALKLKSGDEVIIPAYTSPIVPQVLIECGVKPAYADVDINSLNIRPEGIIREINSRTKAIISVHMFGNPCDNDEVREIASDNGLIVVEDAAQALGAEYFGKKVGSFGDIGLFSFGLGKNMTTMEGGVVVIQRKDLVERAKSLVAFRPRSLSQYLQNIKIMVMMFLYPVIMSPKVYEFVFKLRNPVRGHHIFSRKHVFLKYNSLQAALGKLLLKKIDLFNAVRTKNATRIIDEIKYISCLRIQEVEEHAKPVFLRLIVRHEDGESAREGLRKRFLQYGFEVPTLNDYYLLPYLKYGRYSKDVSKMFERIKKEIVDKVLALPTNPSLPSQDLDKITFILRTYH